MPLLITEKITDGTRLCDATNQPVVFTLLPFSQSANKPVRVQKVDGSANTVTVQCDPSTSDTFVGGGTSIILTDNSTYSWTEIQRSESGIPAQVTGTGSIGSGNAATVTGLSADERSASVYQDVEAGLHMLIDIVPVMSGVPATVRLWIDPGTGTFQWLDQYALTTVGQVVTTDQWVPTNPAYGNWRVAAASGDGAQDTPPVSAIIASFTVQVAQPCPANDITDALFVPDDTDDLMTYAVNVNGVQCWKWNLLQWTQPSLSADPYYWFSFLIIQLGYEDGFGVWHEDPTFPNNDTTLYQGQWVTDSGWQQGGLSIPGTIVSIPGGMDDWIFPSVTNDDGTPNLYRTFRFQLFAVSHLGTDSSGGTGAYTLQTTAWLGADHFDLTPSPTLGTLDLTFLNIHTVDPTIGLNPAGKPGALSAPGANELVNPGFELGLNGWVCSPQCEVVTGHNHTPGGSYSLHFVTLPPPSNAYVASQEVSCKPGDQLAMKIVYQCSAGATGVADIHVGFYSSTGTYISGAQDWYPVPATVWTTYTALSVVAPANAAYALVYFGVANLTGGAISGDWWIDDVAVDRVVAGDGIQATAAGGTAANNGAGLSISAGKTVAALGYTMGLDGSQNIVLLNLIAVYGLPTLPNAAYPAGSTVVDLATTPYKIYKTATGSAWDSSQDPADLVAGTLAANVAVLGTVQASQIQAGTISAGVVLAGAVDIISGAYEFKVNATDGFKVAGNGIVTQIDNASFGGLAAGVKVTDSSHYTGIMLPSGILCYYDANVKIQLGVSGGSGSVIVTDSAGTGVGILYPTNLNIGGNQVVGGRIGTHPVTLADVIAAGVTHGLWA